MNERANELGKRRKLNEGLNERANEEMTVAWDASFQKVMTDE